MRVTWGINDATSLPAMVTDIEIVTCTNAGQADEDCGSSTCSVNAITLTSETDVPTCRPSAGTEMYGGDPVLVRTGLPTDTPIRFELHGKGASGQVLYIGRAGPFVLGEGQRRYVDLHMYSVGRSEIVTGSTVPRFLHTATLLPDGRVLIAGGFTSATRLPTCPEGIAPEARCFDLQATDVAIAFDPSSGRTTRIRDAMLAARGGHTATALPDGRVLIAGGAERAVLAMIPQGAAAVGGYQIILSPQMADGSDGALDTFELFDAYLDAQDDTARDGDAGAGRFLGEAGQGTPGILNQPRFLHAAAAVPAAPERVVLAGGLGGPDSAATWEVFDNDRAGGYGVYVGDANRLPTPRAVPSAVGVGARVWITGGALARDNSQLADVWEADALDPNGTVSAATAVETGYQFPNSVPDAGELHPEYALFRPNVATVANGTRPLVVGWYGPQCEPGMSTPTFVADGLATEYCNSPTAPTTRSFTTSDESGLTSGTSVKSRSFGAMAETSCFRSSGTTRYAVATGGIANAIWTPQASVDVFTGEIDVSGAAQRSLDLNVSLSSPRFFHTSTGLPGLGVVTVGGITFSTSLDQVIFQPPIEVLYLPSPNYEEC